MPRPVHERDNYIGWILRAMLPATRQRRLSQVLAELRSAPVQMKLRWSARKGTT